MNQEFLFAIAHEAHMMGRIYNKLGEHETPMAVCNLLNIMIKNKIKEFEIEDQTIYKIGTFFRRKLYPEAGKYELCYYKLAQGASLYDVDHKYHWNIIQHTKNPNFVTEAEFKLITGGEEFEPVPSSDEPIPSTESICDGCSGNYHIEYIDAETVKLTAVV